MRIVLLGDTIRQPLTGIGRYALSLAGMSLPSGVDFLVWKRGRLIQTSSVNLDALSPASSTRDCLLVFLRRFPRVMDLLQRFLHRVESHKLSNAVRGGVVHGPDFHVPHLDAARVVTIHDLSVFKWSQYHAADRVLRKQRLIRASIDHAHRIITDSEFNRIELIDQFELRPDRVVAIPLACDSRFSLSACRLPPTHGLASKSYGLFVGTIEPRKNLDTLISAWELLPTLLRDQYPLIVAGDPGWQSETLHARLRRAEEQGWLRYLGYVSECQLPALYAHAQIFCFPSWYEGFGLPVLEAMSCGVPVICSSAACLPEVGGDAVRYAHPADFEAWSAVICEVLSNHDEAKRLSRAGIAQAANFSWQRTTELTLSVYRDALAIYEQEGTS